MRTLGGALLWPSVVYFVLLGGYARPRFHVGCSPTGFNANGYFRLTNQNIWLDWPSWFTIGDGT